MTTYRHPQRQCSKCGADQKRSLVRGLCENCYWRHRHRQVAYGRWQTLFVDAGPTRQHLHAFRDLSIGTGQVAKLTGIQKAVLQGIAYGRGGKPPTAKVHRKTEARILAMPLPTVRDSYAMAAPHARVDITGTRRRLRALMAIGYTQIYLGRRISDSKYGAHSLWTDKCAYTNANVAARAVTLFDEIHLIPGPSARARRWAVKKGWAPPLAWDEDAIDDPASTPIDCTLRIVRKVPADFADIVADHRTLGRTDEQIAERIGMTTDAFQRRLTRLGITQRSAVAS